MQIETILDIMRCEQGQKVRLTTFTFQGEAEQWWLVVKEPLLQETDHIPWARFLEKFNEKYFLKFITNKEEVEFMTISQGYQTIVEYDEIFRIVTLWPTLDVESH